jgi:ribonucleotide reductase alpha subunit
MQERILNEDEKYKVEHEQCENYYQEVVNSETERFQDLHRIWREAVARFHKLKQEDAIQKFVDLMNSKRFVNPDTRTELY